MPDTDVRVFDNTDTLSIERLQEGGAFLMDKPIDWTSFDVVNKLRYSLKRTLGTKKIKVGHAGTLDPKADGLLIVCFGKATKKITEFQDLGKEYTGQMYLGANTPSYDTETEIDETFPIDHLTKELLEETTRYFIGKIDQYPPVFSAVKKDGVRLYKKARAGEEVDLPLRSVVIDEFVINEIDLPLASFLVKCQKGTYIRSLVHDFGKRLAAGAYLHALRRTAIGSYRVDKAWDIQSLCTHLLNLS